MTTLTAPLADAKEGYGGKSAGLSKLISLGLPVPAGFALTPEFVQSLANHPDDTRNLTVLDAALTSFRGKNLAVRSSALSEDGETSSFAGIYDTVLNVRAESDPVIAAILKVSQGQFSERALSYKSERQIELTEQPQLGIVIQEMVHPVIAGVAFSSALGPDGKSLILLECVSGLGDKLVSGSVTPTRIEVPLHEDGSPDLNNCVITGLLLDFSGLEKLVSLVREASFRERADQDIEWAIDAAGEPWLLQARPITEEVLVPGKTDIHSVPASPGIAKAETFVVNEEEDLQAFPSDAILVAQVTETTFLPAMRRAKAIVTEEGGILSHAAIISREIGIPCIVGYTDARKHFPTGTIVTVDGSYGTITNETNPNPSGHKINKLEIDWGAAYLFDKLLPVTLGTVTGLFDPNPNGLALHIPNDISVQSNNDFERFARLHFAQSPKRYQSDKYLWYFAWLNFQNIPVFRNNLFRSLQIIETLDGAQLSKHYDTVIESGSRLVNARRSFNNPATLLLTDETLLTCHFLLTVLIPEGYALKSMYLYALPLLERYGYSFSELLVGRTEVASAHPELGKLSSFSNTLASLRNEVYQRLLDREIMRDDYFEDRDSRAVEALAAMNIEPLSEDEAIPVFYREILNVPNIQAVFRAIEQ